MKVLGLVSVLFVSLHLSHSKSLPNADSSAEPGQGEESHDTAYNSIISKYYTTDPFFLEQYDIVEAEAEPLHMEFERLPSPDDSERDTSRDNSLPLEGLNREKPKVPTRILVSGSSEDDLSKEAFKPHVREKKEIPKVRMHVAKKPYKKVMIKKVMRPVSHRNEGLQSSSNEDRPQRQVFSQLLPESEENQEEDIQSQSLHGLSRKPSLVNTKRSRKVEASTNKDEDFSKDFGPRQKKLPGEERGDIPILPFIENSEVVENDPQNVVFTGTPGGPPSKSYFDLMGDFFDEPQINIYPDDFVPPPSKESVPSPSGSNQFRGSHSDLAKPSQRDFEESEDFSKYNDFKREIPQSQLKLSFENSGETNSPQFESFRHSPNDIKSNHLDKERDHFFTPPKYHPYAEPLNHPNPLDLDHIPEDVQIYEQPIPHKVEMQKPSKPSLNEDPKLRSISAHNFGYHADEFTPDNVELDFLKLNAVPEYPKYSSVKETHAPSSLEAPDFFKYAHDFKESKPLTNPSHNLVDDPPRFREIADVVPSFEEFGVYPFDNLDIEGPLVPKEHRSLPMDDSHPSLKFANSFHEDEKKPFGPINHTPDSSLIPEHFEEEPTGHYNPFDQKQEEPKEQYRPFEYKSEPAEFAPKEVKDERYNPFDYTPDFEHGPEHHAFEEDSYDPYGYHPESNHLSEYPSSHKNPHFPSSTFSEEEFVMPKLPPPPEMEKAMRESNFEMRVPTLGARITFNPSMPLFDSFHSGIHSNDIHSHTKKEINPEQRSINFFDNFDHNAAQYQNEKDNDPFKPNEIVAEEPKFSDEGELQPQNPDLPPNFSVVEPAEEFSPPEEANSPPLEATLDYFFPPGGASPPQLDEPFDNDNFGPNPFKRYESGEVDSDQRRFEEDIQEGREAPSSPFGFNQEPRFDEAESFQLPSPEDFFKGLDRPGPFGDGFNSFKSPSPQPVQAVPVRFPPKKEYSTKQNAFFDDSNRPKRQNTKAPVYVPKPNTLYQHEPKVASNRRISSPMNVDEPGFHQFSTQFQRRTGMPIIPPEDLLAVEERGEKQMIQPRNIHVRSIDDDASPKTVLPSPRLNQEPQSRASHGRALFGVSSDLEFHEDDRSIQEPHQFINVENYDQFKAGFNRGNPHHHVQDVQEHLGHNHREEVSWADSHSGYGKHYYEFNHGDHKYKMYHQQHE